MVDEFDNQPPSLDDGWWQSVLSEEEQHGKPIHRPRKPKSRGRSKPKKDEDRVDWPRVAGMMESESPVKCEVIGYNRGGLLVNGDGFHGFVPISHLIDVNDEHVRNNYDDSLPEFVGETLELRVIECDPDRGRVVLSERAALTPPGERQRLLEELEEGAVMQGTITNVTKFGVFVDLGGLEGLVHISELSWGRVRHPEEVAEIGEEIDVMVLQVDNERNRVALSTKRLSHNPWETATERYRPGDVIEAEITDVVKFGAFARLEEGLEGLIHVSEMGREAHIDPWQVVSQGQRVHARVLHVDPDRQRLSLRLVT